MRLIILVRAATEMIGNFGPFRELGFIGSDESENNNVSPIESKNTNAAIANRSATTQSTNRV